MSVLAQETREFLRLEILADAENLMAAYVMYYQVDVPRCPNFPAPSVEELAKPLWNRALRKLRAGNHWHEDFAQVLWSATERIWVLCGREPLKVPNEFRGLTDDLQLVLLRFFDGVGR